MASNISTEKKLEGEQEYLLIREKYLSAKSPQQITELKLLFQKITQLPPKSATDKASSTSTSALSIGETDRNAVLKFDGMSEDLEDKAGFGSEVSPHVDGNGDNKKDCENATAAIAIHVENDILTTFSNYITTLYDITLGYGTTGNMDEEKGKEDIKFESFHHPPIQYRIAFAKYVIKQLESTEDWWKSMNTILQQSHEHEDVMELQQTLLENWYDTLEQLISSRQVLSEPFYRLYEIKVDHNKEQRSIRWEKADIVKIFENENSFVADGTTGLVTWEASIEFQKWLVSDSMKHEPHVNSSIKWILELGCGCGFLAIAMTKCLYSLVRYIATDGSLTALEKAKLNVDENFVEDPDGRSKIKFEKVDWKEETRESFTQLVDGMASIYGPNSGILIGADIVFDPELIPDLVELIHDFIDARAGNAILSCTIRNEVTMNTLKKALDTTGLQTLNCGMWANGVIVQISLP